MTIAMSLPSLRPHAFSYLTCLPLPLVSLQDPARAAGGGGGREKRQDQEAQRRARAHGGAAGADPHECRGAFEKPLEALRRSPNLLLLLLPSLFPWQVRKKNRMDFLDEGVQQRARMEAGRLKLEGIKSDKLRVLQNAGVPDKYTVDLSNKKFT